MKRKRALTLIEIMIAMVLLGALLLGLFGTFRHAIQRNMTAKTVKQKVLQLELFQQKLKSLLATETRVWLDTHPEAAGTALLFKYETGADPDFEGAVQLTGMLYLTGKKQLCLATWPDKGSGRVETLLEKIDLFHCSLFDQKKKGWSDTWPKKKEESPAMAEIVLTWKEKEIPKEIRFAYFFADPKEQITYPGAP